LEVLRGFRAVRADFLKLAAVGAPLEPGLRIFSPDPAAIRVPLQGHFANRDDWCTPAAADGLEATLKACGANYELYRYDANHGFCNDRSAVNYDAASCNLAFERLQLFLTKHLG